MSATNAVETAILELIFKATAWADIAQNDGSGPQTSYWISLHTADPGEAGAQNTSETGYTGYARVEVTRDGTGWTVSGNSASNAAQLTFGQCTAAPDTITHVGLGKSSSGAGTLMLSNALSSSLVLAAGATPIFAIGALAFTCD